MVLSDTQAIKKKHQQDFQEKVDQARRKRQEALVTLNSETLQTVQKLIQFRDEASDERLQLDATKYLAKLQELEVTQLQIKGDEKNPLSLVIKRYDKRDLSD